MAILPTLQKRVGLLAGIVKKCVCVTTMDREVPPWGKVSAWSRLGQRTRETPKVDPQLDTAVLVGSPK